MLQRNGSAVWRGNGMEGKGTLSTQSGVLKEQPYSFQTRFKSEDGRAGTNPEELIGAAHAACFSMALSFLLTGAGHPPDELRTTATVKMEQEGGGWVIRSSNLVVEGRVPGLDAAKFQELANQAKANCPVSKALSVELTLQAKLAS
jgi:osmotically inducible protein OsmC